MSHKIESGGIPFMFRGVSRIYRVVGIQGDNTVIGLNINLITEKDCKLELVFACLGKIVKGSPFTVRKDTQFLVAYEEEVCGHSICPVMTGQYLNKIVVDTGKNLTWLEHMSHVSESVWHIKNWLDETLDNAGIMPVYNDVTEIIDFFFGKTENPEKYPFSLKPLGEYIFSKDQQFNVTKYQLDEGEPD